MNADLLFFCTMCKDKSLEHISQVKCTIGHKLRFFEKGERIASQGDRILHLYILTKGRVKTEMISESGLTLAIEEITAPYPLAAAFLFADENRFPVDVTTLEESEVILISKDEIEKKMADCPGFLRGFMAFTANKMHFLSERLKIFSQKGIKAKIAYYILLREKNGAFELGRSVASLAEYFAVERPSLSRALSEMVGNGVIKFESGRGRILNYSKIKELLG